MTFGPSHAESEVLDSAVKHQSWRKEARDTESDVRFGAHAGGIGPRMQVRIDTKRNQKGTVEKRGHRAVCRRETSEEVERGEG